MTVEIGALRVSGRSEGVEEGPARFVGASRSDPRLLRAAPWDASSQYRGQE